MSSSPALVNIDDLNTMLGMGTRYFEEILPTPADTISLGVSSFLKDHQAQIKTFGSPLPEASSSFSQHENV
jgi:hypothetical protein